MSDHSGYPGAPPGWYDDPAGGPGQRWWDGYSWSEATVLPQHPPPPPWTGAAAPLGPASQVAPWAVASERLNTFATTQRVDDERGMVPVARFAVAMPAVYFLVTLLLQRVNANQLRSAGHQFRIDWHDAENGITPPQYHATSSSFTPIGLVVGLVTVAAVIFACIWQHRGRIGRACPRHSVALLPGLGRRLLVRADRQPVDALRGRARTASRPSTRTGPACCSGGSPCSSPVS